MNITEKTDTELKALGYDQLRSIEVAQSNLRMINEELTRRSLGQPAPDETEAAKETEAAEEADTEANA
jgi:hypothetical protein